MIFYYTRPPGIQFEWLAVVIISRYFLANHWKLKLVKKNKWTHIYCTLIIIDKWIYWMIGQIKKQVVSWKIVKRSEKHKVVDLWNKLVLSLIIIFEPQKFGITMKGVCSSWKQEQVKMVKIMPSLKRKKQEKVKVTNCRLKKAILVISALFMDDDLKNKNKIFSDQNLGYHLFFCF